MTKRGQTEGERGEREQQGGRMGKCRSGARARPGPGSGLGPGARDQAPGPTPRAPDRGVQKEGNTGGKKGKGDNRGGKWENVGLGSGPGRDRDPGQAPGPGPKPRGVGPGPRTEGKKEGKWGEGERWQLGGVKKEGKGRSWDVPAPTFNYPKEVVIPPFILRRGGPGRQNADP